MPIQAVRSLVLGRDGSVHSGLEGTRRWEATHLTAPAPFAVAEIPVPIDADAARAYLHRCSRIIERHAPALTRLDEVLGDGDHGDNMLIGFGAVIARISSGSPAAAGNDLAALLRTVGDTLVSSVGGASGPLYGAAFAEAGFAARGLIGTSRTTALATLLEAAAAGLARRGHCTVGDKTIYDTLAPASMALRAAVGRGADERTAIREAVLAGARGMRSTTDLVARRGLALRLGERSRGHRDPGAASCWLLLRAVATTGRDDG